MPQNSAQLGGQHYRRRRSIGKRQASSFLLTTAEGLENLTAIVAMLNDHTGRERDWQGKGWGRNDCERLRSWVPEWIEVRRKNEDSQLILKMKLSRDDRERLDSYTTRRIGVRFRPDGTLEIVDDWSDPASCRFTRLLRSPESIKKRLGGPCPWHRCLEKWFVRKDGGKNDFCSRTCAWNSSKAKSRDETLADKVEKVESTIQIYESLPRNSRYRQFDKRTYVIDALEGSGISKKFITQVIEGKKKLPPTKG